MVTRKTASKTTATKAVKTAARTDSKPAAKAATKRTAAPAMPRATPAQQTAQAAPAPAGPRKSPAPAVQAPTGEERYRWIAHAAYLRAEKRGFEPGREVDDWLAAEADFVAAFKAG